MRHRYQEAVQRDDGMTLDELLVRAHTLWELTHHGWPPVGCWCDFCADADTSTVFDMEGIPWDDGVW